VWFSVNSIMPSVAICGNSDSMKFFLSLRILAKLSPKFAVCPGAEGGRRDDRRVSRRLVTVPCKRQQLNSNEPGFLFARQKLW